MINWNEVKVGETEIERDGIIAKIIGLYEKWVWVKCHEATWIRLKDDMKDWTIYDPWEEITDQVQIEPLRVELAGVLVETYALFFDCVSINPNDKNFKVDGRRVWKRKGGNVHG